jgi:hypothetical protein
MTANMKLHASFLYAGNDDCDDDDISIDLILNILFTSSPKITRTKYKVTIADI